MREQYPELFTLGTCYPLFISVVVFLRIERQVKFVVEFCLTGVECNIPFKHKTNK